jgi:peroxiredoxin
MSRVLRLAACYNIAWGLFVILFPLALFRWSGMALPRYPQIWQGLGMIVGVYGVAFWLAAADPFRHWPVVFAGLLGKVFGPIGYVVSWWQELLPTSWASIVFLNDVIWWVPFGAILYGAARSEQNSAARTSRASQADPVQRIRSHRGATLAELSANQPVLVVFLRHAGCTFCREALDDLNRNRAAIERLGVRLAIVHMSSPLKATMRFEESELADVHRFSDPQCEMYETFGLQRARFCQLFGWRVWWRGLQAAIWNGHGVGRLDGDGFRLPGVFVVFRDQPIVSYRARHAADRPDYVDLARQARALLEPTFGGGRNGAGRAAVGT